MSNNMVLNNKLSTGGYAAAELFKEFFSSVYSTNSLNINECLEKLNNYINICQQSHIKITVSEIIKTLNSLDFNSCPVLDGIPNILLRFCKFSLSITLCKIFNRYLSDGIYPSQWKNNSITIFAIIYTACNYSCMYFINYLNIMTIS